MSSNNKPIEDNPTNQINQLQNVIHPDNLALANALLKAAAVQNSANNQPQVPPQPTNGNTVAQTCTNLLQAGLVKPNISNNQPKANFNSISSLANLSEGGSGQDENLGAVSVGVEKDEGDVDIDQNPYAGLPSLRWFPFLL